jgi:hypothetical protein
MSPRRVVAELAPTLGHVVETPFIWTPTIAK